MEDVATLETREYNGFNQLVSVYRDGENIAYRYRPDGLRYGKTVRGRNGETTSIVHLWDRQNIVAEVGANEQVNARYLRGINLIVRELDGKNQYYLFNAHGDVIQRIDTHRNILKTYKYDAFGNEESPEPLYANPLAMMFNGLNIVCSSVTKHTRIKADRNVYNLLWQKI